MNVPLIMKTMSKNSYFVTYINTLHLHYVHAAANLNSGYAKVARVNYFCTIALQTPLLALKGTNCLKKDI